MRAFFVFATLVGGIFVQFFFHRYLSLGSASPDAFLLLTVATGFACGPVMGQVVGFLWGLLADASGTQLFGLSALTLTIAGFIAGLLRRRVASERMTGQLVVGLVATLYQAITTFFFLSTFESAGRINGTVLAVEAVLNVVFVPWIFIGMERWIDICGIEREHV